MSMHTQQNNEEMKRLLDAQAQELELRFNQFLKELEDDFNYSLPSAPTSKETDDGYLSASKVRASRLDERLSRIERDYSNVDRKYTIMMWISGTLTVLVFVYLGYVLFGSN